MEPGLTSDISAAVGFGLHSPSLRFIAPVNAAATADVSDTAGLAATDQVLRTNFATRMHTAEPAAIPEPPSILVHRYRRAHPANPAAHPPLAPAQPLLPAPHPQFPEWHVMPSQYNDLAAESASTEEGASTEPWTYTSPSNATDAPINQLRAAYGFDLQVGQCGPLSLAAALVGLGSDTAKTQGSETALRHFSSYFALTSGAEANVIGLSAVVDFRKHAFNRFRGRHPLENKALAARSSTAEGLFSAFDTIVGNYASALRRSEAPAPDATQSIEGLLSTLDDAQTSAFYLVAGASASTEEFQVSQLSAHASVFMVRVAAPLGGVAAEKEFIFFDPNQGFIADRALISFKKKITALLQLNPVLFSGRRHPKGTLLYTQPFYDAAAPNILAASRVLVAPKQVVDDRAAEGWSHERWSATFGEGPTLNELSRESVNPFFIQKYQHAIIDKYVPHLLDLVKLNRYLARTLEWESVDDLKAAIGRLSSAEFVDYLEACRQQNPEAPRKILNTLMSSLLPRCTSGLSENLMADDLLPSISSVTAAHLILEEAAFQRRALVLKDKVLQIVPLTLQPPASKLVMSLAPPIGWARVHAQAVADVLKEVSSDRYYAFIKKFDVPVADTMTEQQALTRWASTLNFRGIAFVNACLRVWLALEQETKLHVQQPVYQQRIKKVAQALLPYLESKNPISENIRFFMLMLDPLRKQQGTLFTNQTSMTIHQVLDHMLPEPLREAFHGALDVLKTNGAQNLVILALLSSLPELARPITQKLLAPQAKLLSSTDQHGSPLTEKGWWFFNELIRFGAERHLLRIAHVLNIGVFSPETLLSSLADQLPPLLPPPTIEGFVNPLSALSDLFLQVDRLDAQYEQFQKAQIIWEHHDALGQFRTEPLPVDPALLYDLSKRRLLAEYLKQQHQQSPLALQRTAEAIAQLREQQRAAVNVNNVAWSSRRRQASGLLAQATAHLEKVERETSLTHELLSDHPIEASLGALRADFNPSPVALRSAAGAGSDDAESQQTGIDQDLLNAERQLTVARAKALVVPIDTALATLQRSFSEATQLISTQAAVVYAAQRSARLRHLKEELWLALGQLETMNRPASAATEILWPDKVRTTQRWESLQRAEAVSEGPEQRRAPEQSNSPSPESAYPYLRSILGDPLFDWLKTASPTARQRLIYALVAPAEVDQYNPFTLNTLQQISQALLRLKEKEGGISAALAQALCTTREHAGYFADFLLALPADLYAHAVSPAHLAPLTAVFLREYLATVEWRSLAATSDEYAVKDVDATLPGLATEPSPSTSAAHSRPEVEQDTVNALDLDPWRFLPRGIGNLSDAERLENAANVRPLLFPPTPSPLPGQRNAQGLKPFLDPHFQAFEAQFQRVLHTRIQQRVNALAVWAARWLSQTDRQARENNFLAKMAQTRLSAASGASLTERIVALVPYSTADGIRATCASFGNGLSLAHAALLLTLPDVFSLPQGAQYLANALKTVAAERLTVASSDPLWRQLQQQIIASATKQHGLALSNTLGIPWLTLAHAMRSRLGWRFQDNLTQIRLPFVQPSASSLPLAVAALYEVTHQRLSPLVDASVEPAARHTATARLIALLNNALDVEMATVAVEAGPRIAASSRDPQTQWPPKPAAVEAVPPLVPSTTAAVNGDFSPAYAPRPQPLDGRLLDLRLMTLPPPQRSIDATEPPINRREAQQQPSPIGEAALQAPGSANGETALAPQRSLSDGVEGLPLRRPEALNQAHPTVKPGLLVQKPATEREAPNHSIQKIESQRPSASSAARKAALPVDFALSLQAPTPNTLNSAFFIQGLINYIQRSTHTSTAAAQPNAMSKAHLYVNLAQAIHGLGSDALETTRLIVQLSSATLKTTANPLMVNLVSWMGNAGKQIGSLLGETLRGSSGLGVFHQNQLGWTAALSGVGHKVGEQIGLTAAKGIGNLSAGVGTALSFANVGLDAWAVYCDPSASNIAQLSVDTVGMTLSVAALGAAAVGATTTSAVLGGTAVPIAGLGIGIVGLVNAFTPIVEGSKAIGRAFADLDQAYRKGGYQYDPAKNAYLPLTPAVVQGVEIDGEHLRLRFGSQYLYRHKRTPWPGQTPGNLYDRAQAIEVRSGIGYPKMAEVVGQDSALVVLPATPTVYWASQWQLWPTSTLRHDEGFDVLRRISDYRFTYYNGFEYAVFKLDQTRVATPVQVVLRDHANRHLAIPQSPIGSEALISYDIQGNGAKYQLTLNRCASVRLSDTTLARRSRWLIDATALGDGTDLVFTAEGVKIHGLLIQVPQEYRDGTFTLLTRQTNGTLYGRLLNWAQQNAPIVIMVAGLQQTAAALSAELQSLVQRQVLLNDYVIIEHFAQTAASPSNATVNRAYYEVEKKRFLYTRADTAVVDTRTEILLYSDLNSAYFSNDAGEIWRTDANTHALKKHYLRLSVPGAHTLRAYYQEKQLYLIQQLQRLQTQPPKPLQLVYRINQSTDEIQLYEIQLPESLSPQTLQSRLTAEALMATLIGNPNISGGPPLSNEVRIRECNDQRHSQSWWRRLDGRFLRPRGSVFQQALNAKSEEDRYHLHHSIVCLGTNGQGDAEQAYFYLPHTHALYQQRLVGEEEAVRVPLGALESVFALNGQLYVVESNGLVRELVTTEAKIAI